MRVDITAPMYIYTTSTKKTGGRETDHGKPPLLKTQGWRPVFGLWVYRAVTPNLRVVIDAQLQHWLVAR